MFKNAAILILVGFLQCARAQQVRPAFLELPGEAGAVDFSFLKEELKDVQVVMLGEKTHADGNVFEMKTKMIEYLHSEMGFNTIAFESGIYDVWQAQKEISKGAGIAQTFEESLYPIWGKSEQFYDFINFFEKHRGALKIYGFDSQISGALGEKNLVIDLYRYCKQKKLRLDLQKGDLELLVESMVVSGIFDDGDIGYPAYRSGLSKLVSQIASLPETEENFYWYQIVKSLLAMGESSRSDLHTRSSFYTTSDDNVRDRQMSENLLEYISRHPGEKIICWGANQHFVNSMASVDVALLKDFIPMGSYVKGVLGKKAYSLAAVTATDSIYLQNTWHATPLEEESFEYYLSTQGKKHLFVSANQQKMSLPVKNRLFSPETFVKARLDQLHDGYLFFNAVTPSISVEQREVAGRKNLASSPSPINELDVPGIELAEVLIFSKKSISQIVQSAIRNIGKNYPTSPFSSRARTSVVMHVIDTLRLDMEVAFDQFDYRYDSNVRSSKSIQATKYNTNNGYEPKSIKEFHSLMYNNPIQYAPFLDMRKSKKFNYELEKIAQFQGKKVYVISFATTKFHSSFTRRMYDSNYSGLIYISADDFAVVKTVESWEVTKFTEEFSQGFPFTKSLSKYDRKEFETEKIETEFIVVGSKYYISRSDITITGKIYDTKMNNVGEIFEMRLQSLWSDFNYQAPKAISNKQEKLLLEKEGS